MKNSVPPIYESRDARWRRGLDPQTLLVSSQSSAPIASDTKSTGSAEGRSMKRRRGDRAPGGPIGPWWVTAGIVLAVWALIAAAILESLDLPEVYLRSIDGRCERVDDPKNPKATCAVLPKKYRVIWM